jgi:hypothetical protein
MPFYNLKISYRYLAKNKIYATLIIGGFSIGFAVFMMIMFYYFTEKKVNKGFAHHKNIYRLIDSKKSSFNLNCDYTGGFMQPRDLLQLRLPLLQLPGRAGGQLV